MPFLKSISAMDEFVSVRYRRLRFIFNALNDGHWFSLMGILLPL
jgi:hypothetical protein